MAVCVVVPLGPACVNITGVRAGDRNEFSGTVNRKGIAVDLTGLTLSAQARKKSTDAVALDAVVTVTDAVAGDFLIRWPGDAVRTWLDGKASVSGVWDLQADGVGDPTTLAEGVFSAVMDVTRP